VISIGCASFESVRRTGGDGEERPAQAKIQPPVFFALSLWTGWAISFGAGELWIRYTRTWPLAAPANAA
jgi:hypothetical protein